MPLEKELQAFYFPHDIGASNDAKLVHLRLQFGWKAIGMYWAIIEALHKEESGELPEAMITSLIYDFYCQEEIREQRHIIDESSEFEECLYAIALLKKENGIATSNRVKTNLLLRKEKSEKAKKSAEIRWGKYRKHKGLEKHADAMPSQCDRYAKKERKGKERKENKEEIHTSPSGDSASVSEFLSYFNSVLGKSLTLTKQRERIIKQRLKEGKTMDQLKQCVDNFAKDPWPDRHKFTDIVYCIGVIRGIDNFDKWISFVPIKSDKFKYSEDASKFDGIGEDVL